MRIAIDPGHGGPDPGAIGFGIEEADLAMKLSHQLAGRLHLHGAETYFTHSGEGMALRDRAALANAEGADLFVSVHCNAFHAESAHGFEVFTSPGRTKADDVAISIYVEVGRAFPNWDQRTDWTDGDQDKEAGFVVLKRTRMPAVLIEFGFITNPVDHFIMTDGPTSELLTSAVSRGIMKAL